MSELPYVQRFDELTASSQPKEFDELLTTSKLLLDAANRDQDLPEISKNPYLRRFTDNPTHTQSLWVIEKNEATYPRDRLSINMADRALWISITYSNHQPDRSLTIGDVYANLNEQSPIRASSSERVLRNDRDGHYLYNPSYVADQLAQFTLHLNHSIDLLGLTYVVQQPEAEEALEVAEEERAA